MTETRRRADEINELKTRNSANHNAKVEAASWMAAEQDLQRQLLQTTKLQRKKAVDHSRTDLPIDLPIDLPMISP